MGVGGRFFLEDAVIAEEVEMESGCELQGSMGKTI